MPELLLDTCAVIWAGNGDSLAPAATAAIAESYRGGRPVHASPFSAWELGTLVSRGRLRLTQAPLDWFQTFLRKGKVNLTGLGPDILVASSFLPDTPPRDPADRIMIATARALNLTLVTRDRIILNYAAQGHLKALEC